jgi:hypothetical protein
LYQFSALKKEKNMFKKLVIPAPYQTRDKLQQESRFHFLGLGFPFSRLRAEALQRAGTGMTGKMDL